MVFGQLDAMPSFLRMGRLETLLTRPMPLLLQLVTADFQLRRLGRVAVGLVVLASPSRAVDLQLTRPRGPAGLHPVDRRRHLWALFALAGGISSAWSTGRVHRGLRLRGEYAGQVPGSSCSLPIRVLFTFVIPATSRRTCRRCSSCGCPGRRCYPAWLGWFAPLFALWIWLLSLIAGAPESANSPGPEADGGWPSRSSR